MTIIPFPVRAELSQRSILAFADMQQEYVSEGRPFSIGQSARRCIDTCADLLAQARQYGIVVVHFRQKRRAPCFNPASSFFDWVEDCRPRASEAVYERALPSIYANTSFAAYLNGMDQPTILLAGFSGETACLASAVDACHRGHRLVFVSDCSASPPLGELGEEGAHKAVTDIIGRFADVATAAEVVALLARTKQRIQRMVE